MRSGQVATVVAALAACELAIGERVDPRDVIVARGLVDHAVARIGVPRLAAEGRLDETAGRIIDDAVLEAAERSDVRSTSGLVEVVTERGIGVIGWGFQPWSPSLDLVGAAARISDLFDADDYVADDLMIAAELPAIWLRGVDDDRVASILASSLATASVSARMRPGVSASAAHQQLTSWLVETATDDDASSLAAIGAGVSGPFVALATAVGHLFSITIARSFVDGVDGIESRASIGRFSGPMLPILVGSARRPASGAP